MVVGNEHGTTPNGATRPAAPTPSAAAWQDVAESVSGPAEWSAQSPAGLVMTQSIQSVATTTNKAQLADRSLLRPIRTGFDSLDQWIGNGLRAGELLLLGGAPGAGKTTFCLQMARNIAASGQANILYACYEHPPEYILERLIVQETIDPTAVRPDGGVSLEALQVIIGEALYLRPGAPPYETMREHPIVGRAMARVDRYAERFHLVDNAPRNNSIEAIRSLVEAHRA